MNGLSQNELERIRQALLEHPDAPSRAEGDCPTDEAFIALAEGSLPKNATRQLLAHVGECTKCAAAALRADRVLGGEISPAQRWSSGKLLYIGAVAAAAAASVFLAFSLSRSPSAIPRVGDPNDPTEFAALLGAIGVENPALHRLPSTRDTGRLVQIIYPRDLVRAEDLDVLRVDLAEGQLPLGVTLEIRRGTDVLLRTPFTSETKSWKEPFPESVRRRLRPGDEAVWGLWDRDGISLASATIRVTESDVSKRLSELDRSLEGQVPPVPEMARIALLLEEKLFTGALRAAEACVKRDSPPAWCWAALVEALGRMDLADTTYAQSAQAWFEQLPDADRIVRSR